MASLEQDRKKSVDAGALPLPEGGGDVRDEEGTHPAFWRSSPWEIMLAILTHEPDVQNGCGETAEMGRKKKREKEFVGKRNNSPSSRFRRSRYFLTGVALTASAVGLLPVLEVVLPSLFMTSG